jgi:hypothetical protein
MLALERLGESGPPAQAVPAPRRAWLKRALMQKRAPQAPSGAVREIAKKKTPLSMYCRQKRSC